MTKLVEHLKQTSYYTNEEIAGVHRGTKDIKTWIRTMALVSTVTEPTVRGPRQPIHVECPTVTDTDLYVPETNVVVPVEANLSLNNSIIFSRMLAIHPARRMRSTVMYCHWWSRHSGASSICEAVPRGWRGKIVAVTLEDVSSVCTWGTIGIVKFGVAGTFSWCCWNQNEKEKK